VKAWTAGTICAKIEGFFIKKPERGGRTAGSILPEFKGFFAKCRDLSDLGRPSDRSNGRGQPATWPLWLPSFWCVNGL